jgi:hypothetical protein
MVGGCPNRKAAKTERELAAYVKPADGSPGPRLLSAMFQI